MNKKFVRLLVLLVILLLAGQAAFQSVKKIQLKNSALDQNSESRQAGDQAASQPTALNNSLAARKYAWQYKGKSYQLDLNLSEDVYQLYQSSQHFYQTNDPAKDWLNDFYAIFLEQKTQDKIIPVIGEKLRQQARDNNLSEDELVELTVAFVQSISYDYSKVDNKNRQVNYPYETLYKKSGVCSDKAVLMVLLLRHLGYGAAILVYPDKDHAAAGIACPASYALPQTAYCYVETTAFLPIGFVPKDLSQSGTAVAEKAEDSSRQFNEIFAAGNLGKQQVYQATQGKVYQGIVQIRQAVASLKNLKASVNAAQPELATMKTAVTEQGTAVDALSAELQTLKAAGNYDRYNELIPEYNNLVSRYNTLAANYKIKIDSYNNMVNLYNQTSADLYAAAD